MLVLGRKMNERIIINKTIAVSILAVNGKNVKVGITAPKEIEVHREEIFNKVEKERNPQ